MKFAHVRCLTKNILLGFFQFLNLESYSNVIKFAQSAGIGDAYLYITRMRKICAYFETIEFYINDSYINLLEDVCPNNLQLFPISKLKSGRDYINLSPHILTGGSRYQTLVRSLIYFSRASLRAFGINLYSFNEYNLADRLMFNCINRIDLINNLRCANVKTVLIAPCSSDPARMLDSMDLSLLIRYFVDLYGEIDFTIVSNESYDLVYPVTYIWFDSISDYLGSEYQLILCSDSWMLHLFSSQFARVCLCVKANSYQNFRPLVPLFNLKTMLYD